MTDQDFTNEEMEREFSEFDVLNQFLETCTVDKIKTNYVVLDAITALPEYVQYKHKSINEDDKFLIGKIFNVDVYNDTTLTYADKKIFDFDGNVLYDMTNSEILD